MGVVAVTDIDAIDDDCHDDDSGDDDGGRALVVRQLVYSCDENNDVICYAGSDDVRSDWTRRHGWTLKNQSDELYALVLSGDETLLIGQIMNGFKRWHLSTKRLVTLRLPSGVRNFPR